ncbi:MAG TPA: glycosyltransferase [Burkholderiaceae bacterium]|nr:glycosyltransferase [Burkholderiaceae bacterium]
MALRHESLDARIEEAFPEGFFHFAMRPLLDFHYFLRDKDRRIFENRQQGEARRLQQEAAVMELRAQLQASQTSLAEARSELVHTQDKVRDLEAELQRVFASKSWRLTKPLRSALLTMKLLGGLFRQIGSHLERHGGGLKGLWSLIAATFGVARRQGLAQTWRIVRSRSLYPADGKHEDFRGTVVRPAPAGDGVALTVVPSTRAGLVSVVVCVHNAPDDVKRCLESVLQWTAPPYEIVLVDDGSAEPAAAYVAGFAATQGAVHVRNDQARGYTFAANQGMRAARGEFLILLNSDTIVTPDWVERMWRVLALDDGAGMVGPLSNTASWQSVPKVSEGGDWAINPLPDGWTPESFSRELARRTAPLYPEMPFLNGFCMLLRRSMIDAVGYFDETHFGAGYGEENDYALRARKAGWRLRLADNAYVFHAQSKSYSHERRKILGERAGAMLAELHGQDIIDQGVRYCAGDRVLEGLRARAAVIVDRASVTERAREQHEGRRVLFILPVIHAGGGGNVVISEARAMRAFGVDACLVNLTRCRPQFEAAYPGLNIPVHYIDDEGDLPTAASGFDAIVATANHTVAWMHSLGQEIRKAYYVQDYEPWFFPEGSREARIARESYHVPLSNMRICTKTDWNRRVLFEREGVESTVIGASFDVDTHVARPLSVQERLEAAPGAVRIAAMVRPSCDRRGPVETLESLRELFLRYGERVRFEIFGADAADLMSTGCTLDFPFNLWGRLSAEQVAVLLMQCDVFLDFSHYQAMGLTAMEAMACAVAVIVPREGGADSFARHEVNALLVDTRDAQARLAAACRLVDDASLRERLARQAMLDMPYFYPEAPASRMLDAIFAD